MGTVENREHYDDIRGLVTSITKAHGLEDDQTVKELETGGITLTLETDENANHFISAMRHGIEARIYQGMIRYAPGVTPPTGGTLDEKQGETS